MISSAVPHTSTTTAHALVDYEDVIPTETIYAIIALTATIARSFGTCSNAFIKLETVEDVEARAEYEQLAVEIFTRYPPRDSRAQKVSHGALFVPFHGNIVILLCISMT